MNNAPILFSRIFVVVLVGVSVAWLPVVANFKKLFDYIQEMTSLLTPPICAVYILAISWKRINEQVQHWQFNS